MLVVGCAAVAFGSPAMAAAPDKNPKQFVFHKAGVTEAEAASDLAECAEFSADLQPFAQVPTYVPLSDSVGGKSGVRPGVGNGGIVGGLIVGLVNDHLAAKIARGNLRRCMDYRQYQRYLAPAAVWSGVSTGSAEERLRRHAQFAAGPRPDSEPIGP